MTQVNTIDLTRRSPSYENRLSKYSHRGFEVYWPAIDRARVDPTIFERSFSRVQGLARLLVLEKLPRPTDRDKYLERRREERGRPPLPWNARHRHTLPGNVKESQPEDVAEWVEEDEVSNYHTVTIPYGPKYHAKRIEKLLFTKDLLLNAEWNKPKDREANLHRHPAFFGSVTDVMHDCCGFCPKPKTDADLAALEEESKIYISGDVTFLKDDPGRQAIGSFHPITDNDWTAMAYIGNTETLCQAIVDLDIEAVKDWFGSTPAADVNRRDHAGRTPLHLAVMCSTPEIVQCLIEHGARLVSRLYNGMTALHLAAHRGQVQMVTDILDKSQANEEQEAIKEEARKAARRATAKPEGQAEHDNGSGDDADDGDDEFDSDESLNDDEDDESVTDGSFVKVNGTADAEDAEDSDEPDIYDVDVLAWDSPLSPLHLAILAGHIPVIELLVSKYGADLLLPVKMKNQYNPHESNAAILTLTLALELPLQQANETVKRLLALGASYGQADMQHISALHYAVNNAKTLILQAMQSASTTNFETTCNFIAISGYRYNPNVSTPLLTAIRTGNSEVVQKLVHMGARTSIDFEAFAQAYKRRFENTSDDPSAVRKLFNAYVEQPITVALQHEMLDFVDYLVGNGADVNTITAATHSYLENGYNYGNKSTNSLLDLVREGIKSLKDYLGDEGNPTPEKPAPLGEDGEYLDRYETGPYSYWTASHDLHDAKSVHKYQMGRYMKALQDLGRRREENKLKEEAINVRIRELLALEQKLVEKGAKSFWELYPEKQKEAKSGSPRNYYGFTGFNNEPYETKISFNIADLTPEKEANYVKLFEAAWVGDTKTVKSLCLHADRPLLIAVADLNGFSPFSIAVIRGHYELAKMIVEVAQAQYQPKNKKQQYHYTLENDEYSDDSNGDDDDEYQVSSDKMKVVTHLVDENFTIDDVAALAANVKSQVSPAAMVAWNCRVGRALEGVAEREVRQVFGGAGAVNSVYAGSYDDRSWAWFHQALVATNTMSRCSLLRYAIYTNNMTLLKFLVQIGNELAAQPDEDQNEGNIKVTPIAVDDFNLGIRLGRVEMIGEIIGSTGFGFPLQKVFQKSGLELKEKPRYYQGLSVHGKKKSAWVDESRKVHRSSRMESDLGVPLLAATLQANVDSVEYFLSDTPLRRYLEFANSLRGDKRILALTQTKGGVKGTLESWLSTRNDLALHMGVLSPPKEDGTQPTFDFLLEKMPHALDLRSLDGQTPLHLAFEVGRYYAAKKLIAAGANQSTKDKVGRNILHTIMSTIAVERSGLLRSLLGMLNNEVVATLLLERCSAVESSGNTPLAVFLSRIRDETGWEESLQIILSFSGGKDLQKMDGAGDYPLHNVVKMGHRKLVEFIVEYRPGLLYWENATGMTVSDVVTTSYLRNQIDHPPQLIRTSERSIKDQPAGDFTKNGEGVKESENDDTANRSDLWRMNRLITSLMAKYPAKRKLVGLQDANEVAKRLALLQKRNKEENRRYATRRVFHAYGGEPGDSSEHQQDEVAKYLGQARGYTKWDEMHWRKNEAGEDEKGLEIEYRGSDEEEEPSRPSLLTVRPEWR